MTDHFEKAMQDIAIKSAANGGPTTQDILTCLRATNEDLDAQHDEERKWHNETRQMLATHVVESDVRDERIRVLEGWRHQQVTGCEDHVRAIVKPLLSMNDGSHKEFHDQHMKDCHAPRRDTDPPDSLFCEERKMVGPTEKTLYEMVVGYGFVKWAMTIALGALIIFAVTYATSRLTMDQSEAAILKQGSAERESLKQEILAQSEADRLQLRQDIMDAIEGLQTK